MVKKKEKEKYLTMRDELVSVEATGNEGWIDVLAQAFGYIAIPFMLIASKILGRRVVIYKHKPNYAIYVENDGSNEMLVGGK